jgi:hypothetical protein
MAKTLEETYITNIESAIRGIRLGTKKPEDVASIVANNMSKLKLVNDGMAIDLMNNYKAVVLDSKNRKQ